MSESVDPVVNKLPVNGVEWRSSTIVDVGTGSRKDGAVSAKEIEPPSKLELLNAASSLQGIVNSVANTSLSFSVEQELSRLVVAVRAVGSDEIIRQFPPEEFITVAKFIAAQNPESMSDDFLKGILFDKYS